LLFYIARALHPAGFGLYAIAIAFSQILGLAGNFGVGTSFRKKLSESDATQHSKSRLLSNGYFITCAVSAIVAAAGVAASGYLARAVYGNPQMATPIAIAAASVFFYSLYNITLAALVGNWKVKESAYANFGYSFSQLALIVILISAGYGVDGAMWGYLLSLAIGFVVGLFFLLRTVKIQAMLPDIKELKGIFSFSLPVFVSHLLNTGVMNFAVVFLGVFATASMVGNYSTAETIAGFVTIIVTAVSFVILPDLSKIMSDSKLSKKVGIAYNESVRYTLLLILPMVVLAASLAMPLMGILVSYSYTTAPIYFAIIALGLMLGIIGNYSGTLLVGFGDTKTVMK
jgi:O-antigen/teichoic acid export membrane protein